MRKGEVPQEPLYTAEDAEKCLELFHPYRYDEIIDIDDNIKIRFNDA